MKKNHPPIHPKGKAGNVMLDISEMKETKNQRSRPNLSISGLLTGQQKRVVSILELLHWAFQRECASLTFDRCADRAVPGFGMEYIMIERARLGVKIDGGGVSDPHEDAQAVVNALAVLPEGVGGRGMAVTIAELARSGRCPDWMEDAVTKVVPRQWMRNRHGDYAAKETVGYVDVLKRGRVVRHPVEMCPITYSPTAQQIAAARRAYLGWWLALLELRTTFQICSNLTCHKVNDAMPPKMPWKG